MFTGSASQSPLSRSIRSSNLDKIGSAFNAYEFRRHETADTESPSSRIRYAFLVYNECILSEASPILLREPNTWNRSML